MSSFFSFFDYVLLSIIAVTLLAFSLRYNWWRKRVGFEHARVLMYHSICEHHGERHDKWRVRPRDFEKQIAWLANFGFTSYTASELASLEKLPSKAVCITFDDGYADNFTNAFEILKKYNFKATIYLVPNQIQNHWERENTAHIANLLSRKQILVMQESGLVEFGSHTLSHVNLSKISHEQMVSEITHSKAEVEKITGRECKAFAYPYGKFDEASIAAVKQAGYTSAVVVKRGVFAQCDDKFTIKRIGVLGTESFFDFWLKFTRIRNKI